MIDFLRYRVVALFVFAAIFAAFVGGVVYRIRTTGSAFSYSIEFTGGLQVLVRSSRSLANATISEALQNANIRGVVRSLGERDFLVRVSQENEPTDVLVGRILKALHATASDMTYEVLQVDSVGASMGDAMWMNLIKAFCICIMVILAYILTRFLALGYAVGAIGALLHDALVIGSMCLFLGYEISPEVMLAVLIVLGYSINDTIIIFARIRDNVAALPGRGLYEVVNVSINETMRRTLLTTLSTLLAVVSFLLVGGVHFRTSSIMLLVGFLFGTYSSIYVASPLMMLFARRRA